MLLVPLLFGLFFPAAVAQESERPTVTVRQEGEADFVGRDDEPLQTAANQLGKLGGGTLVIGAGRYPIRRSLFLPKDVVVRGEEGAVLALPAPVLTRDAAAAGAREIVLADPGEFVGRSRVQILPPVGSDFFADGRTKTLELQQVERVDGATLVLVDPLVLDVPAGSRVGYPHKLVQTAKEGLTTIEDLVFEGGRVESLPMPGHSQRCAIWSAAPFGFGEQRLGPPGQHVRVRNCLFRDWYGRGVAFYNQENGLVEGCVFERISDEAIDLDHFVKGFRIVGNDVRDVSWGIVLNDASQNVVEYNRVEGCEIGLFMWWYEKTPGPGLNEENVLRHNVVRGARQLAIHLARTCQRNTVEGNFYEGTILVEEPTNTVTGNRKL